jgi:hypothetical protein
MKTTTMSQGSRGWVRALALLGAFGMGAVSGVPSAHADSPAGPLRSGKNLMIEQPASALNGPRVRWTGTLGRIEVSQAYSNGQGPYPNAQFISSDGLHRCMVQTQTWEEARQFALEVEASSVSGLLCSMAAPGNQTVVLEAWPRASCTECYVTLEMLP